MTIRRTALERNYNSSLRATALRAFRDSKRAILIETLRERRERLGAKAKGTAEAQRYMAIHLGPDAGAHYRRHNSVLHLDGNKLETRDVHKLVLEYNAICIRVRFRRVARVSRFTCPVYRRKSRSAIYPLKTLCS